MDERVKILKQLRAEEYVWIVYLVIIGLSFYSNFVERNYYMSGDISTKEKYRSINILIFLIALSVYVYFFNGSYTEVKSLKETDSKDKIFFNKANLTASTFILIAGVILLFIAIYDVNLDTEIAFS